MERGGKNMKKIQIVQVHVRFHINGRKGRHKNKQWSWTLCIWNEWPKISQIGTLLPEGKDEPCIAQLCTYDPTNEVKIG